MAHAYSVQTTVRRQHIMQSSRVVVFSHVILSYHTFFIVDKWEYHTVSSKHPNGNTMLQALQWMLHKMTSIVSHYHNHNHKTNDNHNSNATSSINLLEMYCGCGAHTMPIAKTGIFENIVAVELDPRLVDACVYNATLNGCSDHSGDGVNEKCDIVSTSTPIHVFRGDAGEWASKCLSRSSRRKNSVENQNQCRSLQIESQSQSQQNDEKGKYNKSTSKKYWQSQSYQVLLVDPPRAGLDETVCNLAIQGSFEDIIYVSCGKEALLVDLEILCKEVFDVVDMCVTDLFPRTDSVETLVHLRRRRTMK